MIDYSLYEDDTDYDSEDRMRARGLRFKRRDKAEAIRKAKERKDSAES